MPITEVQPVHRRVMGDPGQAEHFALPRYAYVFVTKLVNGDYVVWRQMEMVLEENHWERTRYGGSFATAGDSIYRYDEPVRLILQNDAPEGNVYAICSNVKLTFSESLTNVTTQDGVLGLKINLAPDSIQKNLQNIYSTPYNYEVSGRYYCSYNCSEGKVTHVNMVLYHIASKVDLNWSVDEDKRINADPSQAVRLTYLEVRNLLNTSCFAFRPMENTVSSLPETGYSIPNIVTSSDEGLWWEGRTYFYTIPFTVSGNSGFFPLQLLMRTNGSSGTGYRLTLNQPVTTTSPFVPWIRGNIKLTQPLTDGTYVKTGE